MALQHFFSRVPSRMSLYNRTDGPDTFACSVGVTREFVEKELVSVSNFKPTAEESVMIRSSLLPPVYYLGRTKSGSVFEGCIHFLARDYTGERSSHLTHNLILSPQEERELFCRPDVLCFDPAVFEKDVEKFDTIHPLTTATDNCPELVLSPLLSQNPADALKKYPVEAVKRLLLCMLMTACGKYKSVILAFPCKTEQVSDETVSLMNAALSLLPYHFRSYVSFISYHGNPLKAPGFSFFGMPDTLARGMKIRGIYLNPTQNRCMGMTDADISANAAVINFLYELSENEQARTVFLGFCDRVIRQMGTETKPDLKLLTDLVFLFRMCSGISLEKAVTLNDDVLTLFYTVYGKYHSFLPDEYRIEAARQLKFYSDSYTAIPKPIFVKVTKLYAVEPEAVKSIFISIIFDLFHTDVMRDKLFYFLKTTYPTESPETKYLIIDNLVRVFYGGFLQKQIIAFFREQFPSADPASQDSIVEKLLLTLRTKEIQGEVLEFIELYFEIFSDTSRKATLDTVLLMLPEGDDLALRLLKLVTAKNKSIPAVQKRAFAKGLKEAVERESRKKKILLLPLLIQHDNPFFPAIETAIITEWSDRKIFDVYLRAMADNSLPVITEKLKNLLQKSPDLSEETLKKISAAFDASDLTRLTDTVTDIRTTEQEFALMRENASPAVQVFVDGLLQTLLPARAVALAKKVWEKHLSLDDIGVLRQYLQAHNTDPNERYFTKLDVILSFADAYSRNDISGMAKAYVSYDDTGKMAVSVMNSLTRILPPYDPANRESDAALRILNNYSETGNFDLNKCFTVALPQYNADSDTELLSVAELYLTCALRLYEGLALPETVFTRPDRIGAAGLITRCAELPKKGYSMTSAMLNSLPSSSAAFTQYCHTILADWKKQKGTFLSRLFSR